MAFSDGCSGLLKDDGIPDPGIDIVIIRNGVVYPRPIASDSRRSVIKKDWCYFHLKLDFPEQECPKDGHHHGKTPDNRTTDQRINL